MKSLRALALLMFAALSCVASAAPSSAAYPAAEQPGAAFTWGNKAGDTTNLFNDVLFFSAPRLRCAGEMLGGVETDGFSFVLGGKEYSRADFKQTNAVHVEGASQGVSLSADAASPRIAERAAGKAMLSELKSEAAGVSISWRAELRDDSHYVKIHYTITAERDVTLTRFTPLRLKGAGFRLLPELPGAPVVHEGARQFFCVVSPAAKTVVTESGVSFICEEPQALKKGQSVSFVAVEGVYPAGQLRRAYEAYLAREAVPAQSGAASAPLSQDAKMQWWRDARLGMFIHYGLYSGLECTYEGRDGRGEWTQTNLGLASEPYARAAFPLFHPAADCAEQWAKLAERAGCRYMVLTTKHHEGFALFDAHNSDFTAAKLLGRDIVREFAEACRAHGMRVGFYHSVIDWHQQDYDYTRPSNLPYPKDQKKWLEERNIPRNHAAYIDYLHGQVDDLLSNYGQVDVLWWDYSNGALSGDEGWRAGELLARCRSKQPGIIMNNRLFSFKAAEMRHFSDRADFSTPEKQIPDYNALPEYDWESCMTVGHHWGYSRFENEYKTPARVIGMLEDCVARGGNLLLNIGPKPDGSVPAEVVHVFERLGDWMQVNGEAVYGSRPVTDAAPLRMTTAQGVRYVLLPSEAKPEIFVPFAAAGDAVAAVVLGQPDCRVQAEHTEQGLRLSIPAAAWEKAVEGLPVLKLVAPDMP